MEPSYHCKFWAKFTDLLATLLNLYIDSSLSALQHTVPTPALKQNLPIYIQYIPLTLFTFFWQENEFNICVGVLFPDIPVINHTLSYILNSFSCQKNVNKASGL